MRREGAEKGRRKEEEKTKKGNDNKCEKSS